MIRTGNFLLAALWLCGAPVLGAEWRAETSPKAPGSFPAIPEFEASYSFGWSNFIEAAQARVKVRRDAEQLRMHVEGGTLGLVSALWQLEATHDATMDSQSLRPIWSEQYEAYRGKTIVSKIAFYPEVVWRYRGVFPDPNNTAKWKPFRIPNVYSILSALLFVRSQPLRDGDRVSLVGFPSDSAYFVEATVLGRERIFCMGEERDAFKLDLELRKIEMEKNKPIGLAPFSKFRGGTIWVSDDDVRIPLRAEVNVFIGFVYGELTDLKTKQEQP